MLDRLSILCFAGTYALALVAELTRFIHRGSIRWYTAYGLMILAWVVQTLFLANLALKRSILTPIATAFDSMMVLSWLVALIGLYLIARAPKPVAIGLFILPLVLGLVVIAGWLAPRESDWNEWGGTIAFWGAVHGVFLLLGAGSTCVAFFMGLMYLAQIKRLKSKRPIQTALVLPSLEQSERMHRAAITLAFPLLTAGLLIGIMLNLLTYPNAAVPLEHRLHLTDAKVLSALGMWLVFAILLHARFRPTMRGRSMMILTIVAFGFMVFTWVGVEALRLPTAHGQALNPGKRAR